ncbi:neprilysin-1 [Aplysia californica]|uniref:Neprilysin-1 n=1 Tax=Aplysia californica TaxID=6500 RepID=A0ABM1W3A8_APLCA|nr:neprilysin-1 [Aplysia californica]
MVIELYNYDAGFQTGAIAAQKGAHSLGGVDGSSSQGADGYSDYTVPEGVKLDDICLTQGCVNAASRILTSMDASVAPCDNFYDFACGNWNKMNIIPADRTNHNTFTKLGDDLQAMLKSIIERPKDPKEDIEVTIKAKDLYTSCINETQIDLLGLKPVRSLLAELGGWPVLDKSRDRQYDNQDVIELLVKLRRINSKDMINFWVSEDDKKSDVNIIQLDQPELGLLSLDYYLKDEYSKLALYRKFALDVAVMFGADEKTASRDVDDWVNFEVELAKIMVPEHERRDNEAMYNKMSLGQLADRVPEFDWLQYLQRVFEPVNITITAEEQVVVYGPTFFDNFGPVYTKVDKRVVMNYLIWRNLMRRIPNLPRKYRNIKNDFYKGMYGSSSDPARWFECVSFVNEYMGNALGRLFVEEYFDHTSKETALEMIHKIRNSLYQLLEEAEWMDGPTRIVAKEKASMMAEKIGYPEYILNDTALNEEYSELEIDSEMYFDNIMTRIRNMAMRVLQSLRDKVDKTKWSTTPAIVNAYYSSIKNQILFPAGILQPPFYSKDYPKSLNYGGIGMVIGHEITHGFDDRGRQYDKHGILVQWWDDVVIKRFKERAQCIIDQYSNYTVPEINVNVNGILTQGENIADNGGLKEAYMAYKKYKNEHGHTEKRLPGLLQFNSDQLFFVNFAQVWCGVMRPEQALDRLKTGVHTPGRFRVIGTLQNMESFSETFNCPEGSYMNRKDKCKIW